ncbi:predicted protein [Coccidioides posadasii str. Silveira]|uniref:Predicted protein n=1 Tax=Coccidioides posadasii (strain RMSCC 757 / Silveira) TaxID=443226 RepID=E9D4C4_COCPS|nr:predicted protein [Coccidioides posadasii str. Silveira]
MARVPGRSTTILQPRNKPKSRRPEDDESLWARTPDGEKIFRLNPTAPPPHSLTLSARIQVVPLPPAPMFGVYSTREIRQAKLSHGIQPELAALCRIDLWV